MFRFPDLFSNFTVGFLHAMHARRFEFNLNLFKYRNKSSKRSSLFLVHVMSPRGGELSLSVCPGVGNRTSSTQMPRGVPWEGMVTGRIEPRISHDATKKKFPKLWDLLRYFEGA